MKQLVTGGAGFIGSNYVRHVLAHTDDSVTVLDKLTYAGSTGSLDDLPDGRVDARRRVTCATPAWSDRWSPSTTWWCTSPPSRTTTTRCATRRRS